MADDPQGGRKRHVCIVNVGLFRSGTTTLAEAAKNLGLNAYREFPKLTSEQHNDFLHEPVKIINKLASEGFSEIISIAGENDIICDGWIALLPFLEPFLFSRLIREAGEAGILLKFVATTRDVESTVMSELNWWTVQDLERKAGLTPQQRELLEHSLRERAKKHRDRVQHLRDEGQLISLPLEDENIPQSWSATLSGISDFNEQQWCEALKGTGVCNASPPLPIEAILLTLRLGADTAAIHEKIASIDRLLDQIEEDSLCRYMLVLAIDADEAGSNSCTTLIGRLEERLGHRRRQMQSFYHIVNPPRSSHQPFPICSVWNEMATVAWANNADWVVLLGDDIEIECSYHYRAFYRSFLDIAQHVEAPFGFGCPWWNDRTFPGFPSFPCVGKAHFEIFGGLIPEDRSSSFVNQDLDPYLQRLYIKFGAAPCVTEAVLRNGQGGNIGSGEARYERVPGSGWKDFVSHDVEKIRDHLGAGGRCAKECILLDVIVPSYRVKLEYLQSICSLKVPDYIRSNFIIIVDNPDALLSTAANIVQSSTTRSMSLNECEKILEEYLSQFGNTVRVRCNRVNVGCSASRNRGLDESSSEFVLNLDDDLFPNPDLLEQYGRKLLEIDSTIVGLVGLVKFPRSPTLPLRHAAVLMSYLTFMFEIAERNIYAYPAWGVTANICFRRTSVRFDPAYAKTGGGEDVDFCLKVSEASNGGKLIAVPEACVVHPFWDGSIFDLSRHFFNWAVGDGALFTRHPRYKYWSYPNMPETVFLLLLTFIVLLPFILIWTGPEMIFLLFQAGPWMMVLKMISLFFLADVLVDFMTEYKDRCMTLLGRGDDNNNNSNNNPTNLF